MRRMKRTTAISIVLAMFLAGVGFARLKIMFSWEYLLLPIFLVLLGIKKRNLVILGSIMLGLMLGWWRGQVYMDKVAKYELVVGKQAEITGVADTDAVYGDKSQLTFDLKDLQVAGRDDGNLVGKATIKGFGENMVYKGDRIRATGKVYASRGSKQIGMSFAVIKVEDRSDSTLENIRRRFEAGMLSALPEPMASFGLGLLIGQRSNLPKNVSDALSLVGLTHIVAVSGYNLTIIMRGTRRLLARRSKYQSTVLSLILMGLFVLCTGFSASIVRAALVSSLGLWAWYYGRTFKPMVLLLLSGAITAGVYPIYLWSDIGWYLSFLAFFGVLVVGPAVTKRIYKDKQPKIVASTLIETISAQIMTTPIIMYIFGRFSVIALVANLLVVPLVSVAMSLCLVAGLAGMFMAPIAGWFALPARWLLTYMLDLTLVLAKFPRASIELPLSLAWMIGAYLFILAMLVVMVGKNRGKYAIINSTKEI